MKQKREHNFYLYLSLIPITLIVILGAIIAARYLIHNPENAPAMIGKTPLDTVSHFYNWYLSCERKYGAHGNTYAPNNSCIYTSTPLVAKSFIQSLPKDTIDPFFCDEGMPETMQFYTAQTVSPTKTVIDVYVKQNGAAFGFPVTVEKYNDSWQIMSIACDLDGHID